MAGRQPTPFIEGKEIMIDALFRFPVEDHDLDKRESDGGLATRGIASGNLSTATFTNFWKG